jgi:hypothetical protein
VSINFSEDPKFEVSQKTLQSGDDLFLADRKMDGHNKPIFVLLEFLNATNS